VFGYLIFDLVLFAVLVYLIGGRTSGFEIGNVFFVLLGIVIGAGILLWFLYPAIGHYSWLVVAPLVVLALARYCSVTVSRAALIVLAFLAIQVAMFVLEEEPLGQR
jgi:hypothetical protein